MTTTRRVFLQVVGAGAGAMCVGGIGGCGPPPGPAGVGNVSDFAVGDVKQVEASSILVGRDAGGIYAMTAICTHAGCDLSGVNGTIGADKHITCGCHGSVYSADGTVISGPAGSPLQHWKTTVAADGNITVEVGTNATPEDRVPVAAG